jgi:hypothetical protein
VPGQLPSGAGIPGAVHGGDKMVMLYTCRVCETRSARTISKVRGHHSSSLPRIPRTSRSRNPQPLARTCLRRGPTHALQLAYSSGVVLVRCPGCRNLHLVADHLGYFEDDAVDVEGLLRSRGEAVRRGTLPAGGDRFVVELSGEDLTVLQSGSKSVSLRSGEEVAEAYQSVRAAAATGGDGGESDGAATPADGAADASGASAVTTPRLPPASDRDGRGGS